MQLMAGQWRRRSLLAVTLAAVVPIAVAFVVLFAGTGFSGVGSFADVVQGPPDDLAQLAPVSRQVREARRIVRATPSAPAGADTASTTTGAGSPGTTAASTRDSAPATDTGPTRTTTPTTPGPATTPAPAAPAPPATSAPAPAATSAPAAAPARPVQGLLEGVGGAVEGTGSLVQGVVDDLTAPPGSGGTLETLAGGVRDTVGGLTGTGPR